MEQGCLGYCLCSALPSDACRGVPDHRETRPKRVPSETVAFARASVPRPKGGASRRVPAPWAAIRAPAERRGGHGTENRLPTPRLLLRIGNPTRALWTQFPLLFTVSNSYQNANFAVSNAYQRFAHFSPTRISPSTRIPHPLAPPHPLHQFGGD